MYSKYDFVSIQDLIDESVFVETTDSKVIMYKTLKDDNINDDNINGSGYATFGASHVNKSISVAQFIADVIEKKLTFKTTYIDYSLLVKLSVIDGSCTENGYLKMYNDFIAQYTKSVLAGEIEA